VKKIAIYGAYMTYEPVRQRYWKWAYHRTGPKAGEKWYKKRVWKKTSRMKKVVGKGRYEFHGRGKDLFSAVVEAHHTMPRGYVDVPAEEFLKHPEEYGVEGYWIDKEVVS